jgi:mannose-1-phosphate guanylyltransferase/phosphomannomutase
MKLFINTGGEGERLYPLTKDIPKPLIPICGKPVLHHLIDWAKLHGIREIVMMNGYKSEKIIEYFGDGSNFEIEITHSNEPYSLGSGGALKFAKKHIDGRFAYISGDVISEVDLKKMKEFHEKKNSEMTVLVHKSSHPDDSDILKIDNNHRIIKFVSKNEDHTGAGDLSNAGLCIIEPVILDLMDQEVFNFENYLYKKIIDNNWRFFAYPTEEFIADMGDFERLKKCSDYISSKGGQFLVKQ